MANGNARRRGLPFGHCALGSWLGLLLLALLFYLASYAAAGGGSSSWARDAGTSGVGQSPGTKPLEVVVPPLPSSVPPPEGREPVVIQVTLDAGITNGTVDYLTAALERASQVHAQALVIQLDTPGGLLDATRTIVQLLLQAPLPTIVYVAPAGARAGSAGLFLTLAAHVAAMHPTSNIGAAHPVTAFGGDIQGDMADKLENDTAAWARSLAQSRYRNSDWAEQAVRSSESLTAREAVEMRVVELLAPDMATLLEQADGKVVSVLDAPWRVTTQGARVEVFEPDLRQRAHSLLADPVLVYLLLLLGIVGIYLEFHNPGMLLPGVLGAACLFVVFGVQALPLNSLGLLLIGLSGVLFFAEVYITSFGLLSAGAIACLVLGSSMLFEVEGSSFRLARWVMWTIAALFSAMVLFIGRKLLQVKRQGATSGLELAVGAEAEVVRAIEPGSLGKVLFDGAYWDAAASVSLEPKVKCRIERVEGLVLYVTPSQGPRPATARASISSASQTRLG
jgi:membrane-bound serine protease (ClpP class)